MKKIVLLFLLSIFITKLGFSQFGITAGLGASTYLLKTTTLTYSDGSLTSESKGSVTSFNLGAFYEIKLTNLLFLKPGFLYYRKGGVLSLTADYLDGTSDSYDITYTSNHINVPFDVRFKFGETNKFLLDLGLYGEYCSGIKTALSTGDSKSLDSKLFNSSDYGINIGGGFQIKNFQISGLFSTGLTTVLTEFTKESKEDVTNFTFCINVAYVFGGTSSSSSSQKSSSPSKSSSGE